MAAVEDDLGALSDRACARRSRREEPHFVFAADPVKINRARSVTARGGDWRRRLNTIKDPSLMLRVSTLAPSTDPLTRSVSEGSEAAGPSSARKKSRRGTRKSGVAICRAA